MRDYSSSKMRNNRLNNPKKTIQPCLNNTVAANNYNNYPQLNHSLALNNRKANNNRKLNNRNNNHLRTKLNNS